VVSVWHSARGNDAPMILPTMSDALHAARAGLEVTDPRVRQLR
jgi:hypothetical protein